MHDDDTTEPIERPHRERVGRRQFVQTVGVAGALSAIAGAKGGRLFAAEGPAEPAPASPRQTAKPRAAGPADFPKPAKLLTGSQLDSRFPVSFAPTLSEGFRLVTDYFTALSQRDLEGIAKTLHFPFAIYEDIEPIVINSAADLISNPPPTLNWIGKGKSRVMPGSYDLIESVNVHLYCPIGGAFSMSFNRYTPDGRLLLACDGIYSVTNNDGRWAIQLASTIFHEAEFLNVTYPDAEEAATRAEQNYLAAFGYGNETILNDLKSGRGTYERPLPPGTKTASVNFGYGPRERARDARENQPMAGWRAKGVKSRLSVSVRTEESLNREYKTNLPEFVEWAGGAVGKYGYTRDRPIRPITIHATHDKAHLISGYLRYTADGQLITETRGVSIRIYKEGHWGSAGGLGQVTHHDRSSSKV